LGDVSSNLLALPLTVPRRDGSVLPGWAKVAVFLAIGYLSLGRAFAYLGLPWFSLYIGELSLGAFLLFGPRTRQKRWLQLAPRVRRLRRFEWILLVLLCYGAFEALRGILKGYPAFTAARDTAFNYYPLFLFLGIWAGFCRKNILRDALRALAWWNGCYGLAYLLLLSKVSWLMPGTSNAASVVPLFTEPYGSGIALLGLLAFEPNLKRVWHLMALNTFVLLGLQVRAEWVGFTVGLVMFAWLTKRIKQLAVAGGVLILLVGLLYVTNISLPGPRGEISANYIVARAVAPVSKSTASNLSTSQRANSFSGTAVWRLIWWAGIWENVNSTLPSAALGFGYGYPLGDLNPLIRAGEFIQTPHNDFFYALAYTGWLGVALFALLQVEIVRLLRRSYKVTGQPFGIICCAALLTASMFEDFFEAPFGAIPFFLMLGMAIAPALLARNRGQEARSGPALCGSAERSRSDPHPRHEQPGTARPLLPQE
jgi:hypothetical protein